MAEYIEREATCRDCFHYDVCDYHITEMTQMTVNECPYKFVNKADVVEVRRGEWLPQKLCGEDIVDCSECKTIGSPQWKWCPVCGAKMDGKDGAE